MANIFNSIKVQRPPYSTFDMSHDLKISMKQGEIVPIYCQEVLPGDYFRISSEAMFRMMPMISPPMHKINIFFHTFYCPTRLVWPAFDPFMTGGEIPGALPPAYPTLPFGQVEPSTLKNYLGLPVYGGSTVNLPTVSAIPFAIYQMIWSEWYRDQNLIPYDKLILRDGDNSSAAGGRESDLLSMRKRAWEHDYFTSCLPFAQKGEAVGIPIDFADAQVVLNPNRTPANNPFMVPGDETSTSSIAGNVTTDINGWLNANGPSGSPKAHMIDPNGSLSLLGTARTLMNDLRTAQAVQRFLEALARGGSRMTEYLRNIWGQNPQDLRLERPEYLGGSKATMAISEVLQTSASNEVSEQGNMAGHGISVSGGGGFGYKCPEHGYLMTMCSIRPSTSYYQGLPKHFTRRNREDYYHPQFAHLGEEPVLNQELMVTGDPDYDNATFGYLPRSSDYKFNSSRVAGQMATSLDYWHAARKFDVAAPPLLNKAFIEADPTKRYFAVTDPLEDEIIAHILFRISAQRPLPKYSTPM